MLFLWKSKHIDVDGCTSNLHGASHVPDDEPNCRDYTSEMGSLPYRCEGGCKVRPLADLPWAQVTVTIDLDVRRYFCDNPTCARKIFTERLPTVAAAWARRTRRLAADLAPPAPTPGTPHATGVGCRRLGQTQGSDVWHDPGGSGTRMRGRSSDRPHARDAGRVVARSPRRRNRDPGSGGGLCRGDSRRRARGYSGGRPLASAHTCPGGRSAFQCAAIAWSRSR